MQPATKIDERTMNGIIQSNIMKKTIDTISSSSDLLIHCPHCNADKERLIHSGKKWRCLDCFKSFKTPNYKTTPKLTNQLQKQSSEPISTNESKIEEIDKKPRLKWHDKHGQ